MTKASRLWLLLPALFALGWFLPTLQHGFRSDDFLTVYYFDREAESVRWGRVFEEWLRPWFGVRDLYRPLVSLSFGVNWALSTSPFGFHLLNVLLLAGTALCIAATARRLARDRALIVGLAAGLLVVLHPAAVEPTAWITARTTGLQVFWSAMAYWSFVRWRDGDGRLWLPCLAVLLANASKEGAVLLPVSLVALDLMRGHRPSWRTHLPFVGLVGGYLVFRKLLLGWFTTAEVGHGITERLSGGVQLLGQLLVPPIGGGYSLGGVLFLSMFVLVGVVLSALGTRRAFWCLPWAMLLLLPGTTHVVLSEDELAGRFVFDAVPALALFVGLAFDRVPDGWWNRVRLRVGLGVIVVGLAICSRAWLSQYDDEARQIEAAQQQLVKHAANATPGKPFGVVGLPGLPLMQPQLWGFLTQRPFVKRDLHVVGLSNILTKNPAAASVFADTTAIHALVADGAGCAVWDSTKRVLVPVVKSEPGVVEFVQDPNEPTRFVPPRVLPPTAVAFLEIVSPVPVNEWRAEILGNFEGDYRQEAFRATMMDAGDRTWRIDTSSVLPWMVAATLGGGPAGIQLTCDGKVPPPGTIVRAHARSSKLRLRGSLPAVIDRREFLAQLQIPAERMLEGQLPRDYALNLLLPTGLYRQPVIGIQMVGERRIQFDAATMAQIDYACDVLGSCRVHWFWTEVRYPWADGRVRGRSAFGTCILR